MCARCLGIYLGAALGLLLGVSRGMAVRVALLALTLNVVDVATELAGLHGNWIWVRFGLGLLLGAAGAMLVASASSSRKIVHGAMGYPMA